jgi:hypothetical protein
LKDEKSAACLECCSKRNAMGRGSETVRMAKEGGMVPMRLEKDG